MRIIIKTTGSDVPEGMREMIRRRAHLALGRFANEIDRVVITLDEGASPTCQVSVRGRSLWQVLVRDEDRWPGAAAIHALDRAARDVARRFDRTIAHERNRRRSASLLAANRRTPNPTPFPVGAR
jgi:ribosome-associated translation inhibitor RaiA